MYDLEQTFVLVDHHAGENVESKVRDIEMGAAGEDATGQDRETLFRIFVSS